MTEWHSSTFDLPVTCNSLTGTQGSDGMNKWIKRGAEQVCSIAASIDACRMGVACVCLEAGIYDGHPLSDIHMH